MSLTNFSRSISGHIAVVTGAASGMGEATASCLLVKARWWQLLMLMRKG